MGCDCSTPKKDEALLAAANLSGKATVKQPRGLTEESDVMGTNGLSHSDKVWYREPKELEDGDILSKLTGIVGEANKKEIEIAISKVEDKTNIHAVCQYMINTATEFKESIDKDSSKKHGM